MRRIYLVGLFTIALGLAAGVAARAQDAERPINVAFSDPSKPGTLKVHVMSGGITVKAYNGKEVIIQARGRSTSRTQSRSQAESQGLHRLEPLSGGLSVEEENNVMSVNTGLNGSTDLEIQVPTRTNLNLKSLNGGEIVIEGVDGDIEANNLNGKITLTDVSGSVVAYSLNGSVVASLKRVTAQKPMAFTTLNGNIDVTLPADVKANAKLRTEHGDIYTDFDVKIQQSVTPTVEDTRRNGGRYRIEVDRNILGAINGGGPDFELHTMNGNVYIRKGK